MSKFARKPKLYNAEARIAEGIRDRGTHRETQAARLEELRQLCERDSLHTAWLKKYPGDPELARAAADAQLLMSRPYQRKALDGFKGGPLYMEVPANLGKPIGSSKVVQGMDEAGTADAQMAMRVHVVKGKIQSVEVFKDSDTNGGL